MGNDLFAGESHFGEPSMELAWQVLTNDMLVRTGGHSDNASCKANAHISSDISITKFDIR